MSETTEPFVWPVRVYWEDTDAGGIVFYANYLKFFERGRTEWLRHLGIEQHALRQETGGMFVVSATSMRHHLSARLDDLLEMPPERWVPCIEKAITAAEAGEEGIDRKSVV